MEMKRKMRLSMKLLIGFIITVMMFASLTACGIHDERSKIVFTTGFKKNEIFHIGKEVCKRDEMMVYLTTIQNQYENVYGPEIWNTSLDGITLEENVKETVLAKMAQIKTMYLLAKDKEVHLDEEEKKAIELASEEYFESLNETEIELMGVTIDTIETLYTEYAMADKVYRQIIQNINPEISDDEARRITVQHILIRTVSTDAEGQVIPYSSIEKQEARRKMMDVRTLAIDGEHDFEKLAEEYSEDSVVTYTFGKGEMDQAFEEVSFQLGNDEISGIVESEVGYHIIKCINTFNREETDANKLEIVEERRREAFGQEYDAFVDTLVRNLNQELWNQVTLIHDENVNTINFFEVYTKHLQVNM